MEGIRQYKLVLSRIPVILLILQNRKTPRCSSTEIQVTRRKFSCTISGANKVPVWDKSVTVLKNYAAVWYSYGFHLFHGSS